MSQNDDLNLTYKPQGACKDLFFCQDRQILIAGGVGGGKTRSALEKLHMAALKYPKMRGLIVRKVRASLSETALVTWEDHVVQPGLFDGKDAPGRAHRHSYMYPNGSEIVVCGMDNPVKIMSGEYDRVHIVEATELMEEDLELIDTRLRNGKTAYHQITMDCNPGAPTHWLKVRADEGRLTLFSSTLKDNPRFWNEELDEWTAEGADYLKALGNLTGHRRERLLEGKWVAPEGARWPFLDRQIHSFRMRDKWPRGLPPTYRIIMGLDYGKRAPYCAAWIAIDGQGDLYLFREDYQAGLSAWEQAQRIVDLTGKNEQIEYVYADPSCWHEFGEDMGHANICTADYYSRYFTQDERFGPLLKGFNKSRRTALDTLDLLLMRGNGHPDLYIEEHCVNIWREFTEATWDTRAIIGMKEDLDPGCPDHGITATYYACHTHIAPSLEKKTDLPTMPGIMAARQEQQIKNEQKLFYRRSIGARRVRI